MRDYSIPPYNIVEIGEEVKRIGERLGIHCNLAYPPQFREEGYYSMPTLSEDMVRIAATHGLRLPVVCDTETRRQTASATTYIPSRAGNLHRLIHFA